MKENANVVTREERVGTLIVSAVFLAWGLLWIVASTQIPSRSNLGLLTPAFVPFWAGAAFVVVAAALFLNYWRQPSRPARELGVDSLFERSGLWRVAAVFFALFVYILILPQVHYAISTFLLMAAGLALAGEPLRPRLVLVAALATAVFFVVFLMWLSVPLPGSRYA